MKYLRCSHQNWPILLILSLPALAVLSAIWVYIQFPDPRDKDWVDVLSGLLTPMVGLSVLVIGALNYLLEVKRRGDSIFDKQVALVDRIYSMDSNIRNIIASNSFCKPWIEYMNRELDGLDFSSRSSQIITLYFAAEEKIQEMGSGKFVGEEARVLLAASMFRGVVGQEIWREFKKIKNETLALFGPSFAKRLDKIDGTDLNLIIGLANSEFVDDLYREMAIKQ